MLGQGRERVVRAGRLIPARIRQDYAERALIEPDEKLEKRCHQDRISPQRHKDTKRPECSIRHRITLSDLVSLWLMSGTPCRGSLCFFEQFCEREPAGGGGRLDEIVKADGEPALVSAVDFAQPALQAVPGYRVAHSARQKKCHAAGRRGDCPRMGTVTKTGSRVFFRPRCVTQTEEPRAGLLSQPPHAGDVSLPAQDFGSSQGLDHSYGQAFAALCAAAVNDVAASGRLHAGPEPVSTLAADVRRLICSFRHGCSSAGIIGRMSEQVKKPRCRTRNLYETGSLPHVRNLRERRHNLTVTSTERRWSDGANNE